MPALFGGVGCPPECVAILQQELAAVWGAVDSVLVGGGSLGCHTHGPNVGLRELPDGLHVAVDGEISAYHALETGAGAGLFSIDSGRLRMDDGCRANLAVVDPTGSWFLAAEISGAFPLYYTTVGGGLLFSSHLRPLVRALSPVKARSLDLTAIVQSALRGYITSGRTHFSGINRLRPGQVLRFDPIDDRVSISETSSLWTGTTDFSRHTLAEAAEACWQSLVEATRCGCPPGRRGALMMSAGWDSRTLLATMQEVLEPEALTLYTHGDPGCREWALIGDLCRTEGLDVHLEPLTAAPYDLERLDTGFGRAEVVLYPWWFHASEVLAARKDVCVSSGVYGEILGGHFGSFFFERGPRRVFSVGKLVLGIDGGQRATGVDVSNVRAITRVAQTQKPWFLARDVWSSMPHFQEEIDADQERDLRRLVDRGVSTDERLIGAYRSEEPYAQRYGSQVLSSRVSADVAVPFAAGPVLKLATLLPNIVKTQNRLNREMLLRHARSLADYPTAATLVDADRPILFQEASRLARRSYEYNRWRLHHATRALLPPPRFTWAQDDSLLDGRVFCALLGDLRSDLWDRTAIRARIAEDTEMRSSLHSQSRTESLKRAMLRIASVDRMLR